MNIQIPMLSQYYFFFIQLIKYKISDNITLKRDLDTSEATKAGHSHAFP